MRFLRVLKSREGRPIDFNNVEAPIEALCHKYGLLLLYVFGSYARAEAGKLSDLDIAILPETGFPSHDLVDIIADLQDLFQEEAIDLVDLREAPLTLIHQVLKKGKCLYARDLATKIEHEVRWEKLYFDTEPLRRERFAALERRLRDGTFGRR